MLFIYVIDHIKILIMKSFLFIFFGFFVGLYLSWPGILNSKKWKCFNDIIAKAAENKISIKAALEVSPSYLIKSKNKNKLSKIRIVADACFR